MEKDRADQFSQLDLVPPGTIVEVDCVDLDVNGNGISKWNNLVLTTPNLLPEEKALVSIQYKRGSTFHAYLLKIIQHSPNRIEPECSVYNQCGGCSIQHLHYTRQISSKLNIISNQFSRLFGIDVDVEYLWESNHLEFNYRNRTCMPVLRTEDNRLITGYYMKNSHTIVDINTCPVLDARISSLIRPIKLLVENTSLDADSNMSRKDVLRHICLRRSSKTGEIHVSFVCSSRKCLKEISRVSHKLMNNYTDISGITMNLQDKKNNTIFGLESISVCGRDYINEEFCGYNLKIPPTSFFQINHIAAETTVKQIVRWLVRKASVKHVIDAYCGIGTISLPLSQYFHVTGIEVNEDSINIAKENSSLNNKNNVEFYTGNVRNLLYDLLSPSMGLVLDPPRKGIDSEVVDIIKDKKPRLIAYLSCNSGTMARDVSKLIDNQLYKIEKVFACDFFPQTMHLECLTFLTLN